MEYVCTGFEKKKKCINIEWKLMEAFKMIFLILSIQGRDCKLFDYYEKELEFNKNIAVDLEQIPKFSRFFF